MKKSLRKISSLFLSIVFALSIMAPTTVLADNEQDNASPFMVESLEMPEDPNVESFEMLEDPNVESLEMLEDPDVESFEMLEDPDVEAFEMLEDPNVESLEMLESPNVEAPEMLEGPHFESVKIIENSNFESSEIIEGSKLESSSIELTMEIEDKLSAFKSRARSSFSLPLLDSQIELDANSISASQSVSADYLLENDISRFSTDLKPDAGISRFNAPITTFNTNPNIAITLPDSYFGVDLYDLANHEQRWYNFTVPANRKITTVLSYSSGIYGLVLYELNGLTLNPVVSTVTGSGFESLSYISKSGGTYYLAVIPVLPASTPHLFNFYVYAQSNFDEFELNDDPNSASVHTNSVSLHANLDTPHDEDWFRLNVTTPGGRDMALLNAPTGDHYAMFLYDSSFNNIAAFYADNSIRYMNFSVGTYYIRVLTLSGGRLDSNYWLNVTNANHQMYIYNGNVYFLAPGEEIYVYNGTVYITKPGEEIHFYNGNVYITKPGEDFRSHNGKAYIISVKSDGITINGKPANIIEKQNFFGPSMYNGKKSYVFAGSIMPGMHGTQLQEVSIYGETRTVIEYDVIGFLAIPAPTITDYLYYDTYPTGVYPDISIRVGRITAWLCVDTGQVFHANWYAI